MHRPDTSAFLKCRVCGALFSQKPDLLRHCQAEGHLQAKNNNKPTRPLTANGAMVAVLRGASAGHLQSQPRGLTHLGTSGSASMGMTVYQQHRTLAAVTQQQVTVVHQETSTVKTTQGLVVLMVIDVSGSMAGSKLEAVKRAIQDLCAALHDKDRVSIITFNNTVTVLVAPASKRKLVAQLSHVLAKLSATGGTAMRDAIGVRSRCCSLFQWHVTHIAFPTDRHSVPPRRHEAQELAEGADRGDGRRGHLVEHVARGAAAAGAQARRGALPPGLHRCVPRDGGARRGGRVLPRGAGPHVAAAVGELERGDQGVVPHGDAPHTGARPPPPHPHHHQNHLPLTDLRLVTQLLGPLAACMYTLDDLQLNVHPS